MRCVNPYVNAKREVFGCGRCLPCSIKRRRIWKHRMLLEAGLYSQNAFVTLTYEEKKLPLCSDGLLPSLSPEDVRLFLMRLRTRIAPLRIRYFIVGEYGDRSGRPHYHAALFNFPTCRRFRTLQVRGRPDAAGCCDSCRMVFEAWGNGDVDLGVLEPTSAEYIAGYTTKKMTGKDDARLHGRYPEFARMSRMPGLGHGELQRIVDVMVSHGLDKRMADVPTTLAHGGREMPLGRYLRRELRKMLGRDPKCPQEVIDELQAEVQEVRENVEKNLAHPTMARYRKEALKNALMDAYLGIKWKADWVIENQKGKKL